jgi:hypothetical protein
MVLCAAIATAGLAAATDPTDDQPTTAELPQDTTFAEESKDAPTWTSIPDWSNTTQPTESSETTRPSETSPEPTTTTSRPAATITTTTAQPAGDADPSSPGPTTPADPSPDSGDRVLPVRMTDTLPVAAEFDVSPEVMVAAAFVAALLIFLIAFPAELFNKTYEENKTEIHTVLGRIGLRGRRLPSWAGLLAFLALSTVLSTLLAGDEGAAGNPVAQIIGFLVAIPVVTFAYGLPAEWYERGKSRIPGLLEVLAPALVVAVLCAGLSTLLQLSPPYLYGLFIGFMTKRKRHLSRPDEGRAILAGTVCLLACAVGAWLLWNPVHTMAYGDDPTWPAVVADAVLFWIFVLATESLVFALPPLRFLDGRKLRDWHVVSWLIPQTVAVAAFVYVFILRADLTPPDGSMLKALAFFLAFGALSGVFWLYFQWSGRPTVNAVASRSASVPGTPRRRTGRPHDRGPTA